MKPTMKTNSAHLQTLHDSVSCSLNTQTSSISVQVSRVHSWERKQNQEVTVSCGIAVNDLPQFSGVELGLLGSLSICGI